jgi:hypothetical protein
MKFVKFLILFVSIALCFIANGQSNGSTEVKFNYLDWIQKFSHPLFLSKIELGKNNPSTEFIKDNNLESTLLRVDNNIFAINTGRDSSLIMLEKVADVSSNASKSNEYVSIGKILNNKTILTPRTYHFLFRDVVFLSDKRPNFNFDEVVKKIKGLGLKENEDLNTNIFGVLHLKDRLFINDEDPNRLLVIWLDNNKLLANFLSNNGNWVYPTPKVIHQEIWVYNNKGEKYQRSIESDKIKNTIINDLNIIKQDDGYIIGYSLVTTEFSQMFNKNAVTCHVSKLNGVLDVINTAQMPVKFDMSKYNIFTENTRFKVYSNNDAICCVIQSPISSETGDELFVQCFDQNLNCLSDLECLSKTNHTQYRIIPEVACNNGFLITYGEVRKNTYEIFSQFISSKGRVSAPISVFSFPKWEDFTEIFDNYDVILDANQNLMYYLVLRDVKTRSSYLCKYKLKTNDFFNDLNYNINKENWHNDPVIKEINSMAESIDNDVISKKLMEYSRNQSISATKSIFVDKNFNIKKLSRDSEINDVNTHLVLYYDKNRTIRLAKEITVIEGRIYKQILFYYNHEGQNIWRIRINGDSSENTNQLDFLEDLLKAVKSSPYDWYHDNIN